MLVIKKLGIKQIITITWRFDLLMILFCGIIYLVNTNLFKTLVLPASFPALLGTAVAFFIGFNNNQAYNRWWEARTIWGSIVNDSRTFTRNINAFCKDYPNKDLLIHRHLLFLNSLTASLRKYKLQPQDLTYINQDLLYKHCNSTPTSLLNIQANNIVEMYQHQIIDGFQFNSLNNLLQNFCDSMGKSERINNTPYPITYLYFTELSIWIFILLATLAMVPLIGVWSIFFGWLIGFVYNVIDLNGREMMNPFVDAPMCIPLNMIVRNIEITALNEISSEQTPEPIENLNNIYIN